MEVSTELLPLAYIRLKYKCKATVLNVGFYLAEWTPNPIIHQHARHHERHQADFSSPWPEEFAHDSGSFDLAGFSDFLLIRLAWL